MGEYKPIYSKDYSKPKVETLFESEIPEYVIIIKSGHAYGKNSQLYYVIVEDPFDVASEVEVMTMEEIEERFPLG